MNTKLRSRLLNWKFQQACRYLEGEPAAVQDLVRALAGWLGDSGFVEGAVGEVVDATLGLLDAYDAERAPAPEHEEE